MYQAMSECAAMHPDPVEDEDDDEAMPGAGGWITADSVCFSCV